MPKTALTEADVSLTPVTSTVPSGSTETIKPAATVTPLRQPPRIAPRHFRLNVGGYINSEWTADIVHAHTLDDILKPDYWANVTSTQPIKAGDEIKAWAEDGSWLARLFVRDKADKWAKVALLNHHKFDLADQDVERATAEYVTLYRGRIQKHCVVRIKDNAIIKEGFGSDAEARIAMAEHVKAMRR